MNAFRWYWLVLGAIAIILAISIAYTLTRSRPLSPRAGERSTIEEEVGQASAVAPPPPAEGAWVAGNCVVEPVGEEMDVAGVVPGRIAAIFVDEGDFVQPGDVLVELSSGTERAAARAAGAEVAQAEAELSLLQAGTRPEEVQAARAEARAARAQAELSQGVFERLEQSHGGGGVTDDELERARHQAHADQEAAASAEAALRQALRGPREQEIAEAQAGLEAARARLEQAEEELAARQIEAPGAGEVLELVHQVGEHYQPGEPVVILGDTRSLRARMEVDERDVGAVQKGASARVSVSNRTFDAEVVKIGQRVKPKQILTERPGERTDVRVLEVVLAMSGADELVVGQRGVCYAATSAETPTDEPAPDRDPDGPVSSVGGR